MPLLENAPKDSLTMCYTKDSLLPFMEKARAEYAAYQKQFSVMLIDIDGFKSFNDKHGHIFGDEALKYFSSSLRLNLDDEDCILIRFGGDEFVIIFPGRAPKDVYRMGLRTERNIRKRPFLFKGKEYKISFSGGIASCPSDGVDAQDLIDKADKAMYFSKRRGDGRITQYSRIKSEVFKWAVKILIVIAIIASILAAACHIFKITPKNIITKIRPSQKTAPVTNGARPTIVHLKSGNKVEGTVISENADNISLRFNLVSGEGTVVIKKSDISRVDRGDKT
jgi:diguanylate cyclase (GGDEF)-like protein